MASKLIFPVFAFLLCSFAMTKHPFYISVTDCKYNPNQKSIQISTKLFSNDIEDALKKITKSSVDIINPKNKAEVDSLLSRYIKTHLKITINNRACQLNYVGYEKEEESVWTYLEITNISKPKTVLIENTLLYDFLTQQTNIVHMEINDIKKSKKITHPDNKIEFIF